jgi:hypothetical protein
MILKIFPLSVIFVTTAFAISMVWPEKKELPDQLSVTIDIPPTWGSHGCHPPIVFCAVHDLIGRGRWGVWVVVTTGEDARWP